MLGSPAHRVAILLIEDDPVYRQTVASLLTSDPKDSFEIVQASSIAEGLPLLVARSVDVVLLDLHLPDAGGIDVLDRVQRASGHAAIVVLTGSQPDQASAVRAVALGAQDYLLKNQIDRDRLVRSIRYALERKRTVTALESTLRELESANRGLREFASVVGHDLKAPLRGIDRIVEDLVTRPELSAGARDGLQRIRDRLDLMRRLIEGVQDYSSAGQDEAVAQDIESSEVVRHALQLVAPPAQFKVQVAPDLPRLRANPVQLEQVFQNLIGNAVRHHPGPSGNIRVGWESRDRDVAFFVEDDGSGLPPGLLERLFHRRPLLTGGVHSGLGLAIVEKLVHLNGGELHVESTPKKGSRFEFTWPRAPARRPVAPLT